jgi:hypothetical protein
MGLRYAVLSAMGEIVLTGCEGTPGGDGWLWPQRMPTFRPDTRNKTVSMSERFV